jgi:hypothetical protein
MTALTVVSASAGELNESAPAMPKAVSIAVFEKREVVISVCIAISVEIINGWRQTK